MIKRVTLTFSLLLICTTMLATLSGCALIRYKNKIADTQINAVNLETVKNGKYEGFYDVEYINAKVLVTVDNHKITDIQLIEHKYGNLSGEPMVQKVLNSQSLKVDTISGATNSCKTVLKAIEMALHKGQM